MRAKIILLIFSTVLLSAQPMSNEKFIKYKRLAPEVIDIINDRINTIVSCFQREKSLRNMNQCLSGSGKSIETMIRKLIPEQTDKLCPKNSDGQSRFVWSDENYETVISELKNVVEHNVQNKRCILESETVEEYGECLNTVTGSGSNDHR
jgi:hypothetical protein